jgi:hypothetical protein
MMEEKCFNLANREGADRLYALCSRVVVLGDLEIRPEDADGGE